jgi:SpoVK/Ycf46/Vps4 family AAA+-type ATPase
MKGLCVEAVANNGDCQNVEFYMSISLFKCIYLCCICGLNIFDLFSGAEIRSVCTEAGMFAIRARRKVATEKDFLEAVNKVIKSYAKFSATPRYMTYN